MLKITFFIVLLLTATIPAAFAVEEISSSQRITLLADNTAYVEGDVITISGKIDKVILGLEVSLQIFFEKNMISILQLPVSQDGMFSGKIPTGDSPYWKNEGPVTIKATYGDTSRETIVMFFKDTSGQYTKNFEVKIPDGGTFDIPYAIKGGEVISMELNQRNLSIEIDILTDSNGVLDINLLRDNIDSLSADGRDIEFIVLVYEDNSVVSIQTDYKKIEKDDNYRAISIPIKNGDSKIEIVGTHVVPEFGTIAMIVLAVSIVSIIAVSAKSRLSIMPRI